MSYIIILNNNSYWLVLVLLSKGLMLSLLFSSDVAY